MRHHHPTLRHAALLIALAFLLTSAPLATSQDSEDTATADDGTRKKKRGARGAQTRPRAGTGKAEDGGTKGAAVKPKDGSIKVPSTTADDPETRRSRRAKAEDPDDAPPVHVRTGIPVIETPDVEKHPMKIWGFNDAMRQYNIESPYGRFFYARRDQVLEDAYLVLRLDDEKPLSLDRDIRALEVQLNGEPIHVVDRHDLLNGPRKILIPFDYHLLLAENEFKLTWLTFSEGPCQPIVAAGVWTILKDGYVGTTPLQLPLQNELGLLPLPFFDQRTDREPTVQIHFLDPWPPTPDSLEAAALVASYFGLHAGSAGVRFPVTYSPQALPEGHAVILATNGSLTEKLGLDQATGPTIQMIDHPGVGQSNYKLLIVHGRDGEELQIAAMRLVKAAWGTGPYYGEKLDFYQLEGRKDRETGEDVDMARIEAEEGTTERKLPGWILTERKTRFAQIIPNADQLSHHGHAGDTLRLEFRIHPLLLAEPAEYLKLQIEYIQKIPAGYTPAKLDVEFNGLFLKTLPAYTDSQPHTDVLYLPRDQLRGANRLQVHVSALQHEPLCNADSWDLVVTTVTGNSVLELMGDRETAPSPDVEAFIYDGLPYTLNSKLGSTTLVVPDMPAPEEVGAALSIVSNLVGATGQPAEEVAFVMEAAFEREEPPAELLKLLQRDLIVVGSVPNSRLLVEWSDKLPLSTTGGAMRVRIPPADRSFKRLMFPGYPYEHAEQAARFLAESEEPSAVMAMQSPLKGGRTMIGITADRAELLPSVVDLQGYTEARLEAGGDLLLIDGEDRAVFRLGPAWARDGGRASWLAKLQWFMHGHWLLMVLLALLAALLLGLTMRSSLKLRRQVRMAPTGGEDS